MAGSDNGIGDLDGRGQRGRNDVPSYAPTDPGWSSESFSNLDLGESTDKSARPVRRLDLPPLAGSTADELSSDSLGMGGIGQPGAGDGDLGVFGSGPRSSWPPVDSAGEVVGQSDAAQPFGSASSNRARDGVPPHPLAAAGAETTGQVGDRTQAMRSVGSMPHRSDGSEGTFGHDDVIDRGFEEQFSHNDALGPGRYRGDDEGRSHLELGSGLAVEKQGRNWTLPAVGLLAVAALLAGYFLFVREDSDSTDTFASDETPSDLVDEEPDPAAGEAATDDTVADTTPAVTELSDNPVLSLTGAAEGPLETETEYEMMIEGVPAGAEYLVVVDDLPQEPALNYLPVLILPEGRHSIRVDVSAGGKTASTNPVDIYVLAPELTATYRANLSSVSIADEGWDEAMRQFDEFRAAGHEGLMLSPSDPYPSLLPGFWNLYVPGFSNRAEAQAYCEGAGLAIPDACFPAPFDPAEGASDG